MYYSFARRIVVMAGFTVAAVLAGCGGGGSAGDAGGSLPNIGPQNTTPQTTVPQTASQSGPSAYDSLVISDGAVQYYRLDEASGTTAADSSGHGANASYLGTTGTDYNLAQTPGPITQETQGWYLGLPSGASHGVLAPGIPGAGNTSSWTLEAWVKMPVLPAQYGTIAGNKSSNRLLVSHNGALLYQNPTGSALTAATPLRAGTLYHIALKSDLSAGANGVVSITINGVKDANTLSYASAASRQGFSSNYYWGQYDTTTNYKWTGYLGRVAYYTTALPDARIAAHYNQGLSFGSATPTPIPQGTPTPTPGPTTIKHVMVGGYVYGYGGTPTTVALSSIAPWVTWAQTDEQHAAALRAAGIKVDVYMSFWRNHTTDNPLIGYTDLAPGGAHAAAEVTDCNGKPIYDPSYGGGYEADPRTAAALGHAQVVASYREGEYAGNYDAMFSDQTGAVGGMPTPCNYNQATYDAATDSVHSALTVPMWINALGAFTNPASAVDLANPSNVIGAMCEECYARNGTGTDVIQTGANWQNVENAEIAMAAKHKVFWDYARASGDPTVETALRTYVYASFLLSYDPAYSMFEEAFQTPSGFPVMPEVGLVPQQPLTTASTVTSYIAPGGAYFREFAACYYLGSFVGNCAVAVNPSGASAPIPSSAYTHSMTLSGSGVLNGGSVNLAGPQVTLLAPSTAAILFP